MITPILMVGAAVVMAGCVPLMRGTLTQVRAIGWTPEGAAIGLAQKIDVGRDFYLVSPEGSGTFSGFRERGIFVLVRVDGEIPADHRVDERRLQFDSAFARPNADGFVVLLSDRGWKTVCVLVSRTAASHPAGALPTMSTPAASISQADPVSYAFGVAAWDRMRPTGPSIRRQAAFPRSPIPSSPSVFAEPANRAT